MSVEVDSSTLHHGGATVDSQIRFPITGWPQQICHNRFATAGVPKAALLQQVCQNRFAMAELALQVSHGTAATVELPQQGPQQGCHSRFARVGFATAGLPQQIRHSKFAKVSLPQQVCHSRFATAGLSR